MIKRNRTNSKPSKRLPARLTRSPAAPLFGTKYLASLNLEACRKVLLLAAPTICAEPLMIRTAYARGNCQFTAWAFSLIENFWPEMS